MAITSQQIELTLNDKQRQRLLECHGKIIHHLESRIPAKHEDIADLQKELSSVVEQMPEVIEVLTKMNRLPGQHTHLRLVHEDNEILNLPWTMARDPSSEKLLGHIEELYLSKCLPGSFKEQQQELLAPPLKILVMISSPEDTKHTSRLSYEQEEFLILQAFAPLLDSGRVEIDFTDDGSLEALEEKLRKNKYHILHFSGHASFRNQKTQLQLEDHLSLNTHLVSDKDFTSAVSCNPDYRVPLVVLSSCQTAQGIDKNEEGLRGVTDLLLKAGVPTVISMGMSIRDKYATLFCAHFYQRIAEPQGILPAFHNAKRYLRNREIEDQCKSGIAHPQAIQWTIPNLYAANELNPLVDWDVPHETLKSSSYRFVFESGRLLLSHDDNYRFIGRRRDKARVLPLLAKKVPIQLQGQGGVGKTALAEHLIQRLFAAQSNIHPFLFNETTRTLQDIQKVIQDYLKGALNIAELQLREPGMDQFAYLIDEAAKVCQPVFVFDNLETFQIDEGRSGGGPFAPEYEDIKKAISYLCQERTYHIILTGRYPLEEFPHVESINLNQVPVNDFWRKCCDLDLKDIVQVQLFNAVIQNSRDVTSREKPVEFFDIIEWLHQSFGGNYRALEFFNKFIKQSPDKCKDAIGTLEDFRRRYADDAEHVRTDMAENLFIEDLFGMLSEADRKILPLLSRFRIPVRPGALRMQVETAAAAMKTRPGRHPPTAAPTDPRRMVPGCGFRVRLLLRYPPGPGPI